MISSTKFSDWSRFKKIAVACAVFLSLIFLLLIFFPWDWMRGPINRYVSAELGRRFEITQRLEVDLGLTTTVRASGIEIANPPWAEKPNLLSAKSAEFDIKLWPLLAKKVELPRIRLVEPIIHLQAEPDGSKTWNLSRETADSQSAPVIGDLILDQGTIRYLEKGIKTDITVDVSIQKPNLPEVPASPDSAQAAAHLPLQYQALGLWKNVPFSAHGRTGGILQFAKDAAAPFPIEVTAKAGATQLKAQGVVTHLALLSGIDANFDLQGKTLDELYPLLGVALPTTPAYRLRGKLQRQGEIWTVSQLQGILGNSDIAGNMRFDPSAKVPFLTGKLQSKVLDFKDLAPVIGVKTAINIPAVTFAKSSPTANLSVEKTSNVRKNSRQKASDARGKVLPNTPIDVSKLQSMNADVIYSALDVRHVESLPIEKVSAHIKLNQGVLHLNPLSLGVAGGTVTGVLRIDSNAKKATFATKLDVNGLKLSKILPTVESTKSSLGTISGDIDLQGTGNSVAQMLGSATGNMAVLTGKGEISNILLEFLGLDGGEIIKFFLQGDKNVPLRCGAIAFDVKQGLMTSRVLVLDTSDTVINGQGKISLADETLDLVLKPAPKDKSILSLKSPLIIAGTFAEPQAGPDKAALAGRVGLAVVLGAINPLFALAATIETGPGKDIDCKAALQQGRSSKANPANPANPARMDASVTKKQGDSSVERP